MDVVIAAVQINFQKGSISNAAEKLYSLIKCISYGSEVQWVWISGIWHFHAQSCNQSHRGLRMIFRVQSKKPRLDACIDLQVANSIHNFITCSLLWSWTFKTYWADHMGRTVLNYCTVTTRPHVCIPRIPNERCVIIANHDMIRQDEA